MHEEEIMLVAKRDGYALYRTKDGAVTLRTGLPWASRTDDVPWVVLMVLVVMVLRDIAKDAPEPLSMQADVATMSMACNTERDDLTDVAEQLRQSTVAALHEVERWLTQAGVWKRQKGQIDA